MMEPQGNQHGLEMASLITDGVDFPDDEDLDLEEEELDSDQLSPPKRSSSGHSRWFRLLIRLVGFGAFSFCLVYFRPFGGHTRKGSFELLETVPHDASAFTRKWVQDTRHQAKLNAS
jgi:hypothetical protein